MKWRTRLLVIAALFAVSVVSGIITGRVLGRDLPNVRALASYRPPGITSVQAADATELQRFGEQRRVAIPFRRIPRPFLDAVLATEDPRFRSHVGVDVLALMRAGWRTVVTRDWGVEGGSTVTMQLARKLFLSDRKTLARKLQEMVLALRIEQVYSKEEILAFYANQVYMGHGRYGIEAASQFYFDRSAEELELPEASLLAGLLQRPEALSPIRHPERALARRRHVLRRMVVEGFLDAEAAERAAGTPLRLERRRRVPPVAPYFVEEVRRTALAEFGEERLYRDGMTIRTTLDPELQRAANVAVRAGLLDLARRLGDAPPGREPGAEGLPREPDGPLTPGTAAPGIVLALTKAGATVEVAGVELAVSAESLRWTKRTPAQALERGKAYPFEVLAVDEDGVPTAIDLQPEPTVQAALVALETATGAVRALVGGYDFEGSEFDRAVQARRQAGSAFKPFIYAAALEAGAAPNDQIADVPTVFVDPHTGLPYQPENFEKDYQGLITLRHALEHSRNIATVRLLNDLRYRPVIDLARRMGIEAPLHPYPSLALGSMEVTLLEITAAYSVFPNQGVRVEPHSLVEVLDREGRTLFARDVEREPVQVLSPATAYQMVSLLQGVVERGSGKTARGKVDRPIGGKTGTTDDYSDAWFVGFTPELTLGVWVGRDLKEPIGKLETGARAALPIWLRFLNEAPPGRSAVDFPRPASISLVPIDGRTGRPAGLGTGCPHESVLLEAFVRGQEPAGSCTERDHRLHGLPYGLQGFPLSDSQVLRIPAAELAHLATAGAYAPRPSPDGKRLLYWRHDRLESLRLDLEGDDWSTYRLALAPARRDRAARDSLRVRTLREARRAKEEDPEGAPAPEDALPAGVRLGLDGMPAQLVEVTSPEPASR